MEIRDQEFKDGVLVREVVRTVPDPEPRPEEVAAAKVVELETRLEAMREALVESTNAAIRKVAADADAKVAARTPPRRVP